MAYSVVIAGPAERDLDQALNYIANVLAAPSAAASLLDEFERLLVFLADNPSLFGVDFDVSEAVASTFLFVLLRSLVTFLASMVFVTSCR